MRLWSLHPQYLDASGLVALWREALLAKAVLEGKTKGYTHHPQLERFLALPDPIAGINFYLSGIYVEAVLRGYHFNQDKIESPKKTILLSVTKGQLDYEFSHLKSKLKIRDPGKYRELTKESEIQCHPSFHVVEGTVCSWERPRPNIL